MSDPMMMTDMKVGDVFQMEKFQHVVFDEKGRYLMRLSMSAPKGEVMLFMLLGAEPKDGSRPLDLEKRMNDLGWIKDPKLDQ